MGTCGKLRCYFELRDYSVGPGDRPPRLWSKQVSGAGEGGDAGKVCGQYHLTNGDCGESR